MGYSDFFKALDELGEERICNIFDDDAQDAAAARDQASGMGIGKVLELIDGLPHALAEPFADRWRAVDGARHGCDGDLGECGNGADIRVFGRRAALCFSNHE